ncbi:hypothetical protein cypCar_00005568 [Cyprinus carpio]|nr:hypothetical protein cypCar_00005568 [Cyprinus carpio]
MKKKVNPPQQTKVKDISSKETQGTTASDAIKDSSQDKMHLRLSQTDRCFLKFLNEDRQKLPSFCDITLTVYGKMYRAHKVVLAFGSGYFHAKFSGNPELQHATIDIIEVSTFGHLLNFLYTSEFDVSESQIPALAEAACFLDMMEATHSAGCQVEDKQNVVTTRRSAHQRRTPAKFENRESENGPVLSGKPGQKSLKDVATAFEEEEEDDESEEEQQNERSSKEGREETVEEAECADGEKQEEEHVAAEQTEAQEENEPTCSRAVEVTGHVFPEGLAPVIIQSTNKKTLKGPRCEKTFDRIGRLGEIPQSDSKCDRCL